jgi:EmrB/QacA subfamily drug resistance transporter
MENTMTKRPIAVLALLFVGVLMGALDISIVGPAIPSIESSIHVPQRELAWIFSIYILFNLVGISLLAKLSDLFGRRLIYVISVGIFAIGSIVVAFSPSFEVMLAGRAIQGIGSSGIFPVASAVIGDLFPVEKRGRALGLLGAVFGIAFLTGPFIAGTVLHYFTWQILFLINIPVALFVMIFAWRLLPGKVIEKEIKIDWTGIILLGLALGLYAVGITNIDTSAFADSIQSFTVLPLIIFAAILCAILIMVESTTKNPVIEVKFFKSKEIRLVGFIALGYGFFQSSILFLPSFAVKMFSVTPSAASFMLLPLVMATALGSPISGRLVDKIGSRIIIMAGLAVATSGLVLFSFLSGDTNMYYLACVLLGIGLSMRSALNYIMLNAVDVSDRASSQGILIIFISIGQITGSVLIGAVAASMGDLVTGFKYTFLLMSAVSAVLLILAGFLQGKRREITIAEKN